MLPKKNERTVELPRKKAYICAENNLSITMADYIETEKIEEEEGGFSLKTLWDIFVLNWQIVLCSVVFFVACGFVYLRYARPAFSASMKVLIKDDDGMRSHRVNGYAMDQLGMVSNSSGFDNELEILTSTSLSSRVVKNLKLYVRYVVEGRVKDVEIYGNSPVIVDFEESRLDDLKNPIMLTITREDEGIRVKGTTQMSVQSAAENSETTETTYVIDKKLPSLPATVVTPVGTLLLSRNVGYALPERDLYVTVYPVDWMSARYASIISASPTTKTTSVALVSIVDGIPNRCIDYLNALLQAYNDDANEDKNEIATKTEEFIRERINIIKGELDETEFDMEAFKKRNELINLANDATTALSASTTFQQKQVEMQTELLLAKSLVDYMKNPANSTEVIPANLGLSNQAVASQIAEYNKLVLSRARLVRSSSETNPVVVRIDDQMAQLWPAIGRSVESVYEDLRQKKRGVDEQYNMYQGRVKSSPTMEHTFNNIARQQEIKAGLYLTLLQKREENYISLASTARKGRLINKPVLNGRVSPKNSMVLLGCLVAGFLVPMGILYLLTLLRYRIEGRSDVERLTKLSILADIPIYDKFTDKDRGICVRENRNDMMEESFRGLRTNMNFVLSGGEKVILCTSCIPGEGKTFVASNLAMSLALLRKRVLLIGLDIRKPRLVKLFGLTSDQRGITTFLSEDKFDKNLLEEQIHMGVGNKNLDVLPAGIIPPNPAEIILRQNLDDAINYLRGKYDYIIIDTPPVGLVSDSLTLGRLADMTLFVTRADYSPKSNFRLINDIAREGKLPKVSLVLNGMDLKKKKYGYYYGYGRYGKKYGYGYGYGYARYGHYGLYGNYGNSAEGKSIKES